MPVSMLGKMLMTRRLAGEVAERDVGERSAGEREGGGGGADGGQVADGVDRIATERDLSHGRIIAR